MSTSEQTIPAAQDVDLGRIGVWSGGLNRVPVDQLGEVAVDVAPRKRAVGDRLHLRRHRVDEVVDLAQLGGQRRPVVLGGRCRILGGPIVGVRHARPPFC